MSLKSSALATVFLLAFSRAALAQIKPVDATAAAAAMSGDWKAFEATVIKFALSWDGNTQADLDRYARLPFNVSLLTPYARIAMAAAEAKRTFSDFKMPNLDIVNAQGVQIVVTARNFNSQSIDKVVLKRGEAVIQPTKAEKKPTTITNGFGASRTVTEGVFAFPLSAFEPTGPVTIVFVGEVANFEWTISARVLSVLH